MKSTKRGKNGKAAAKPKRSARAVVSRRAAGIRRASDDATEVKPPRPNRRLRIPPLLLEKEPPARQADPTPTGVKPPVPTPVSEQPQLKLTPRDPHWLHAHWEFPAADLRDVSQRSAAGHMALRLFEQTPAGRLVSETRVRPEAMRWFVHVETPGIAYAGQLGYYDTARKWVSLVSSPSVRTPTNGPSAQGSFELATLCTDGTLERHGTSHTLVPPWSVERDAQLQALTRGMSFSTPGDDSLALSQPPHPLAEPSPSSAAISSWSMAPSSFSSPMGSAAGPSAGFHLEVNTELIVYGATEPDAELTIGERQIPLAPDGSFRARFALPDGAYELPVRARAADGHDARAATLRFSRDTATQGAVGQRPQEPGLKPPAPENC